MEQQTYIIKFYKEINDEKPKLIIETQASNLEEALDKTNCDRIEKEYGFNHVTVNKPDAPKPRKLSQKVIFVDSCVNCPMVSDLFSCPKLGLSCPSEGILDDCPLMNIHVDYVELIKNRNNRM